MLYLDHNASVPMPAAVQAAVCRALAELPGNSHSAHGLGRAAAAAVEQARARVGELLGRSARQVCFTSGATEANAWALQGLRQAARDRGVERPLILASAVEHESVRAWADLLVSVDGRGVVDLGALDALLAAHEGRVAAVSVMAANNETGVIQPLDQVAIRCRAVGVPLHCDAAQAPGRIGLAPTTAATLVTLSAHKLGGPQGVGALVGALHPPPLLRGGAQERGARAGTVPVAAVVGMGEAARLCRPMDPGPRDRLEAAAVALGGEVMGEGAPRLPNTSCLLFDVPGDLLVMGLDLEGVAASAGAACSSGAAVESHVLRAMGRPGLPLRLSLGPDQDPSPAIAALTRVLARARAAGLAEAS